MDNLEFAQKLEERTQRCFENIVELCKEIPRGPVNDKIVGQLVGASGSTAANYIEANEAVSKKDFCYRIRACRKESKEARFWLRGLAKANVRLKSKMEPLFREATEFVLLFSKVIETAGRSSLKTD